MRFSFSKIFACLALATPMLAACNAQTHVVGDDTSDSGAGNLPVKTGPGDGGAGSLPTDAGPFGPDDANPLPVSDDGGPAPNNDDGGPVSCGSSITFDLAIDSTDPVCYSGLGTGWMASFACGNWLAVSPAGSVDSPLSLDGECTPSCVAGPPSDPSSQSYTWNGTYYPVTDSPQGPICGAPTCAPAGTYVATFCVADGTTPDASMDFCTNPWEAPPTCKQVTFQWPPASGSGPVQATITPTPSGG